MSNPDSCQYGFRLGRIVVLALSVALFFGGCGGGGGGGGAPPYILASVFSFPVGAVPEGFSSTGSNAVATVQVLDNYGGAPIENASVSINSVALAYSSANFAYLGELALAPGASVSLNVTVGGSSYTASSVQFTSYPSISTPTAGATWLSTAANVIAWSGTAPNANALYALAILDTAGQLVWPSDNTVLILPTTLTSYTVNPGSVTAGSRLVTVGLVTVAGIPHADASSGMVIGGFNYVPISVANAPTASLVSIAVTPANPTIAHGGTVQLSATGTYSDSSTRDLTTQVTWITSDTSKVSTSTAGLATGVSYGSATLTATSGGISGSTLVSVFQTNPSPPPPLSHSVAYQIDYAHSGRAVFGSALAFPASPTWSVTLNGPASYPLIAQGKVFVTTANPGGGTSLYALDTQTGNVVWGPASIAGTYARSGHAYDHGQVFVVNSDGLLQSFDAATGHAGWSKQLPGQYLFSAPPTAVNGIVYVGGAGSGGTLYAVDEATGNVLWTASVANGDQSSPAVSSDGVFVSYPCQVYKFDPVGGFALWHYSGGCSGGGGRTPAYANNRLYVRDPTASGQIFDASLGTQVGSFSAAPIPAFTAQTGFFLSAGNLQGIDLSSNHIVWNFAGDGHLVSAPIVIDQVVIVGSSAGKIYAVDATSGAPIWTGFAGAAMSGPDEHNLSQPLTGLGAGEGYLIVPAGNVLTGWHLSGP